VVEGKEWLVAFDERTCEFCMSVKGEYNLDQEFFEKGDTVTGTEGGKLPVNFSNVEAPPLHPNCRCTIIPVIK